MALYLNRETAQNSSMKQYNVKDLNCRASHPPPPPPTAFARRGSNLILKPATYLPILYADRGEFDEAREKALGTRLIVIKLPNLMG